MSRDPRYDILFQPLGIGPKTAPNRFVAVPHSVGHSHLMPNGARGIRAMRAEGGWGIVSTGLTEIDPTSDLANLPYERLWDDEDIVRHADLTSAVHRHGALAAVELGHTGLRSRGIGTGYPPLAPSCLPILKPDVPFYAKAMSKGDITAFRESHRHAIRRAKRAGYDIVYVYCAHDASILWHFLTPAYNFRNDEYGGSFENRLRLFREVVEESLEEAANEIAIAVRFAVHELSGPKKIAQDGEGRAVIAALAELPDLWDVNVSGWSRDSATSRFDEEGFQEDHIAFVKKLTSKPVLGVGRYTSPDRMVKLLKSGVLDLIGAARPSIADPFLPNKIKEGRIEDIRECIGCNVCVAMDGYGVEVRCTQNPTVSEEWRRGWHPEKVPIAKNIKNILIVGSGPAGLEAALTLGRAGHQISVAEKAPEFGGRVARESKLKGLSAWRRVMDYRFFQLQRMANVELFPGSQLDADAVGEFGADVVLVATGAKWLNTGFGRSNFSAVPGFATAALTPDEVMDGHSLEGPIVIYDDDHAYMGNVLALHLASLGHAVHLATPNPIIASWLSYTLEQPRVIASLHAAGVRTHPNTVARSWQHGGLAAARFDAGEDATFIDAKTLLFIGARMPDNRLSLNLDESGIAHRCIGDCEAPGLIQAAVYSGHRHARDILACDFEGLSYRRERAMILT